MDEPEIKPGVMVTKLTSGRRAQVSAITKTHAILYWPDQDKQTSVSISRLLHRTSEWRIG